MNFEELKTSWNEYDRRLQQTTVINDKIVISMIRERSASRLEKIRRQYNLLTLLSLGWLLFFGAVLAGNPFDYIYPVQYIPAVIYIVSFAAMIAYLIKGFKHLNTEINNGNLEKTLRSLVNLYENPGRFKRWSARIFLFAGSLFFLSFLPVIAKGHGWQVAWGVAGMQIVGAILIYMVAAKLGAFKERNAVRFSKDLEELNELRSTAEELVG